MRALLLAALAVSPAIAADLAYVQARDGSRIVLTDERGPCIGQALMAVWISPDQRTKVVGCYQVGGELVGVSFLDGDRADIPLQALKKPERL